MKILVACELFGVVRRAFQNFGHEVYSCDLLPSEDNSKNHFIEDCAITISRMRYNLIIMHPPCTYLAVSGNRWYGRTSDKYYKRLEAIKYTIGLYEFARENADKVCMENPVGVLPIKPTQYIQPWQFGHCESKKTGLWLHNLPKLQATKIINKPSCGYWKNQTPTGQNKLGPSKNRKKERSRTYLGIAIAMAKQWE